MPRRRESLVTVSLVFAPLLQTPALAWTMRVSWRTFFAFSNALSSGMSAGPSQVFSLSCLNSSPISTCGDVTSGCSLLPFCVWLSFFSEHVCAKFCLMVSCLSLQFPHHRTQRYCQSTQRDLTPSSSEEREGAVQHMAANSTAMVWPLEGQGTGSCQPGSQQLVAGLDAHEHTLAENATAVCVEEAVKLSHQKHCSLHAVCKPGTWTSIGSQLLGLRGSANSSVKQSLLWLSCFAFLFFFSFGIIQF